MSWPFSQQNDYLVQLLNLDLMAFGCQPGTMRRLQPREVNAVKTPVTESLRATNSTVFFNSRARPTLPALANLRSYGTQLIIL